MEKTFTYEGSEYTIKEVTAIADVDDYNEEYRQDALLVTTVADSGEKFEWVVFGFDTLPEDDRDFENMESDPYAWDSYDETLATVRYRD